MPTSPDVLLRNNWRKKTNENLPTKGHLENDRKTKQEDTVI